MPKLGLAFRLLNREHFKQLIELCPEVHDAPWDKLSTRERGILSTTLHFLECLQTRGLVEAEHPAGVKILPSAIPNLRFRRLVVEGEQYVNAVVEDAISTLRHRGIGMNATMSA
jgi:hypothetical protein